MQKSNSSKLPTSYYTYNVIFLFSLILNLLHAHYIVSPFDHVYSDMHGYLERGYRLSANANFVPFDVFYPPGTAFFYASIFKLAGFQVGLSLIVLLQAACIAGASVLAGLMAEHLFLNARIAFILSFGVACYYPFIAQSSFFMAEPLFVFITLFAEYLFIRSFRKGGSPFLFLFIGLTLGLAVLVKGQGFSFVMPIFVIPFFSAAKHLRPLLPYTFVGLCFPLTFQIILNKTISDTPGLYLAANDAFNTYLGQSRRQAIGCLDREKGTFYIFHQNNTFFDDRLLPPITLPTSILNRGFFQQETLKLWQENPRLQLIRSLHSIRELFSFIPHWPLRNIVALRKYDVAFQYLTFFLITLAALYSLVSALNRKKYLIETTLLVLPIIGIACMAFVSMGQPRYLIPFKYQIFILAVPAYLEILKCPQNLKYSKDPTLIKRGRFVVSLLMKREILFSLLLLGFIYLAQSIVHSLYLRSTTIHVDGPQTHYLAPLPFSALKHSSPIYWLEFGKNRKLMSERISNPEFQVSLENFRTGASWPRVVSWHVAALGEGKITITFPPYTLTHIALFLTDGDSFWRMSRIRSGSEDLIADLLHDGRWFLLPLSPEEKEQGKKLIDIQQLNGSNVAVSALKAFYVPDM